MINFKMLSDNLILWGKNIDVQRVSKHLFKALSAITITQWIRGGLLIATGIAIGALSRQPEINNEKKNNERLLDKNEELRDAVKRLNDSVGSLQKKCEALKAYQFTEKAKENAELRGCIQFQYATKEYLELLINKDNTPSEEDLEYLNIFSGILNGIEQSEEKMKVIDDRTLSKYKEQIQNLIEFNCLPLLDYLGA